jgi:thioredoxin 1
MGENGKTFEVTDGNFSSSIEGGTGLAIIDFWAAWCGPCRIVAPIVEQLANDYAGRLQVGKLDVDANQQIATRFNIRSIPSILFFKDGKHVDTVVGAVPRAMLERKILEHLILARRTAGARQRTRAGQVRRGRAQSSLNRPTANGCTVLYCIHSVEISNVTQRASACRAK